MKKLIITARFREKAKRVLLKPVIPNLSPKDASYNFHAKKLLEIKHKDPNLYNSIMYWN